MSAIRVIYHPVDGVAREPNFPATDQHPDAVRYLVGLYYVDAIGGAPTQAEVDAVLNPRAPAGADAMLSRQRDEVVDALDAEIAKLPSGQQPVFRAIQQLLKG